jgi:hypothetical protein
MLSEYGPPNAGVSELTRASGEAVSLIICGQGHLFRITRVIGTVALANPMAVLKWNGLALGTAVVIAMLERRAPVGATPLVCNTFLVIGA